MVTLFLLIIISVHFTNILLHVKVIILCSHGFYKRNELDGMCNDPKGDTMSSTSWRHDRIGHLCNMEIS